MKERQYKTTEQVDDDIRSIRSLAAQKPEIEDCPLFTWEPDDFDAELGLCVPSLSPKLKKVARGRENRLNDLATGLMFTSEKHPWPCGPLLHLRGEFGRTPKALGPRSGPPLAPYLQVDLRQLGQSAGRNVGSGVLQIWSEGIYKWLRVIPHTEFRENALLPVSEEQLQVFDDELNFVSGSLDDDDNCAYEMTEWKDKGIFVENLVRKLEFREGSLGEWVAHKKSPEVDPLRRLLRAAGREWHDVVSNPSHDIRAFGFGESIQGAYRQWVLDSQNHRQASGSWRLLLQLYCRQIPWNFAEGTAIVFYRRRPRNPDKEGTPLRFSNICEHGEFQYAMYWERWN